MTFYAVGCRWLKDEPVEVFTKYMYTIENCRHRANGYVYGLFVRQHFWLKSIVEIITIFMEHPNCMRTVE